MVGGRLLAVQRLRAALTFTATEWAAFTSGVQAGEFD
jgi:hypothetical protein